MKWRCESRWEHGKSQGEQKSLYHFATFAIVNELLIIKNRPAIEIARRAKNYLLPAVRTSGA